MELVSEYKESMTTFIANCIQTLQRIPRIVPSLRIDPDMVVPEQIVFREAVYNAVTLNALALYDFVDFDSWLTSIIPAELAFSGSR